MNRRDFLKVTAAGVAAIAIPGNMVKPEPLPEVKPEKVHCLFCDGPWNGHLRRFEKAPKIYVPLTMKRDYGVSYRQSLEHLVFGSGSQLYITGVYEYGGEFTREAVDRFIIAPKGERIFCFDFDWGSIPKEQHEWFRRRWAGIPEEEDY